MASAPTENRDLVAVGPVRRGRYSEYTEEMGDRICSRIAGGETLTAICLDEDMPPIRTVSGWLMRHDTFQAKYALAREQQMHVEAEQIREIADNAYEDYYIDYKEGENGVQVPYVVVNNESVRRAQLRIDARKWRAERLNRRVYGNSVQHQHEVAVHPAAGAEQVPAGIGWLAQFLPGGDAEAGPEPDTGGVGEE